MSQFMYFSDTCLTADKGVMSLIQAGSHTFAEIDREIISTAILLPSADSRKVVVGNKHWFTTFSSMSRKKSVV